MHDEDTKPARNDAPKQMGQMEDEKHIHLMHGETKAVVTLVPGKHTFQLIVGGEDHVIRAQAPHSKLITIMVQ